MPPLPQLFLRLIPFSFTCENYGDEIRRSDLVLPPDPSYRTSAYVRLLSQTPCAPMGGIARGFLHRLLYDVRDLLGSDGGWPSRSRRVVQPCQSSLQKSLFPSQHSLPSKPQLPGNLLLSRARRQLHNDSRPFPQPHRRRATGSDSL